MPCVSKKPDSKIELVEAWLSLNSKVKKRQQLSFDGACHQTAHKVALQSQEDNQRQDHAHEGS